MAAITFPEKVVLTPLLMLKQARSLVERGWTQGTLARDKEGIPTHPQAAGACSWCMSGALHRVAASERVNGPHFDQAWHALDEAVSKHNEAVSKHEWPPTFTSWNDDSGRTHPEVLAVFDAAIASLTPAAGLAAIPATETEIV